jgi:hypothetical protein
LAAPVRLPTAHSHLSGQRPILATSAYVPEAMILALLQSADEEFDWSGRSLSNRHSPGIWYWPCRWPQNATLRPESGLADYDPDGLNYGAWTIPATRHQSSVLRRYAIDGERIFPDRQPDNSELAMARRAESILTALIQEQGWALQARQDRRAIPRWPASTGSHNLISGTISLRPSYLPLSSGTLCPLRCLPDQLRLSGGLRGSFV